MFDTYHSFYSFIVRRKPPTEKMPKQLEKEQNQIKNRIDRKPLAVLLVPHIEPAASRAVGGGGRDKTIRIVDLLTAVPL